MYKRYIVRVISTEEIEQYLNDMSRKGLNVVSVAPRGQHYVVTLENVYG